MKCQESSNSLSFPKQLLFFNRLLIYPFAKMSDDEVDVHEVHQELEQLKQSAKRKKGRGFADTDQANEQRGKYDTLTGEGSGPQRSIDVSL
jgi:hypothetical protein